MWLSSRSLIRLPAVYLLNIFLRGSAHSPQAQRSTGERSKAQQGEALAFHCGGGAETSETTQGRYPVESVYGTMLPMRLVALATGPEADRTKVQIPTRGSNAARNRAAMLVRLDMTGLIGFSFGYYAILDRYELLMLETDFPS